jgi:hypothetical protein
MAKLKDDGEFTVEGTVTMWLPLEPEEGERLEISSSQTISPLQVWVSVHPEDGQWEFGSIIVKGRLYRKDNAVGGRWADRMYSGPLDKDFEGPDWLVALLEREIPRRLSGRTQATDVLGTSSAAPAEPVKERSPQRASFDTALNVLLIKENLDGAEWALQQILDEAEILDGGPGLGDTAVAEYLRTLVEKVSGGLDKRTAELATREN